MPQTDAVFVWPLDPETLHGLAQSGSASGNKSIQPQEIVAEHVVPQSHKDAVSVTRCRLLLEVVASEGLSFAHVVAVLAVRGEVGVFGFGVAAV
jgi:hypothetical protein